MAGLNVKALTEFMGHSSITTTFDRYGHLLPGAIDEATVLLDAYLAGVADGQAKAAEADEHVRPEGSASGRVEARDVFQAGDAASHVACGGGDGLRQGEAQARFTRESP